MSNENMEDSGNSTEPEDDIIKKEACIEEKIITEENIETITAENTTILDVTNSILVKESEKSLFPKYGWKVKLNHVFPETRDQNLRPSLKLLLPLIPVGIRYLFYHMRVRMKKKHPCIECFNFITSKQMYGAPIGGIGAGTIGRGFKGEFCRFQLIPGIYEYETVHADQFIVTVRDQMAVVYQKVLSAQGKPTSGLSSWDWSYDGKDGSYCALYPRAWTQYNIPEMGLKLTCRQISPIIPHNYKDSSLPVSVFVWSVENNSEKNLDVSITFTFQNGSGNSKRDQKGNCKSECFNIEEDGKSVHGVSLQHNIKDMPANFAIASLHQDFQLITRNGYFDPKSNGSSLWEDLGNDLKLNCGSSLKKETGPFQELGIAVCNQVHVPSKGKADLEFCLVWDIPKIHFKGHRHEYFKRYTRFFGRNGDAAPKIAHYALTHYREWENDITTWQNQVLNDPELPDWYKSALFNELYVLADGGSIWLDVEKSTKETDNDVRHEYGRFAYLESHEYRLYNTYDVHFYASFALAKLWPKLQLSLQYDISETIEMEDRKSRWHIFDGHRSIRKSMHCVPHDIGDPYDDPFVKINAYYMHDISEWKDLNIKFVLQVYRDYDYTKDEKYLSDMWPLVVIVMKRALQWDSDGDGMIENSGQPDQTYDSWYMKGISAYCGGLWLAALHCTVVMAQIKGEKAIAESYSTILEKAKTAFEKALWTGTHYKFDSSNSESSESIMADQLCGYWYLKASNIDEEVFPSDHVNISLKTIYDNNVLKFANGKIGAVNSMKPSGKVDQSNLQSYEVWTGVTYALASTMIHEGMITEGFKTAEGIYRTVYETIGLGFETPEALMEKDHYRSIGYMRPLSIWSIQAMWEKVKQQKGGWGDTVD